MIKLDVPKYLNDTAETVVRLIEQRNKKNLTLEQLSKLSGVSVKTIYRIEHSLTFPKISTLYKLGNALGIDLTTPTTIDRIKELGLKFTVYPPIGERTEWTVRFLDVCNTGGGGDTFEKALADALENIEVEIKYLKENNGIDILENLKDEESI